MIKYIGSKRTLVPRILAYAKAIRERTGASSFCDAFTGTTRVAQALKRAHFQVTANDLASYSEILAIAYIEADADEHRGPLTAAKIGHLNALAGRDGYFTQTFCVDSRYFQPGNGRRIDAIREEIERISDDRVERAILLTSLLEAADRVDSTTGLQMAYLKEWASRSFNAMEPADAAAHSGRGDGAARRRKHTRLNHGTGGHRVSRSALQSALVFLELPHLGNTSFEMMRPSRTACALNALRLPCHEERVQREGRMLVGRLRVARAQDPREASHLSHSAMRGISGPRRSRRAARVSLWRSRGRAG